MWVDLPAKVAESSYLYKFQTAQMKKEFTAAEKFADFAYHCGTKLNCMPTWLAVILEIVKITIPALIVFLTAYYMLKTYMDKQYQVRLLELKQSGQKDLLPLRMQAYERLMLLCERIDLPNLVTRLRTEDASASALRTALLIGLQQEFEHNLSQQVYVSENLWEILKMARQETAEIIQGVSEQVDSQAPAKEYAARLLAVCERMDRSALNTARVAVRREASLLL
jgi:hypothetical protein